MQFEEYPALLIPPKFGIGRACTNIFAGAVACGAGARIAALPTIIVLVAAVVVASSLVVFLD